jgi:uncharacterized protein (TIGR02246 family)
VILPCRTSCVSLAFFHDSFDPQIAEQLHANGIKSDDAFNKGDAAGVASVFTEDAVLVTDQGPVYGRQAIEKMHGDLFQKLHFSNHITKVAFRSACIANASCTEICAKAETAEVRVSATTQNIAQRITQNNSQNHNLSLCELFGVSRAAKKLGSPHLFFGVGPGKSGNVLWYRPPGKYSSHFSVVKFRPTVTRARLIKSLV